MDHAVVTGAEAYRHDAGPIGVLLAHGFTGSPASMVGWGRSLAEHGMTVRVPRLPGHGTHWKDLNKTRWQDWYATLEADVVELRERCETVVVCGLSMGGALSLRLAEQRPADVDGLVLVNPAIALKRRDLMFVPLLSKLVPSMAGIGNDIAKPGEDEIGYDRTPLTALASQLELWREVRSDLARVSCPILYFRSAADHVVDDSSQDLIRAGVSSSEVEFIILDDSFHVATLDHDAPLIFKRSAAFIQEIHGRA